MQFSEARPAYPSQNMRVGTQSHYKGDLSQAIRVFSASGQKWGVGSATPILTFLQGQ